jgi:putative transposase
LEGVRPAQVWGADITSIQLRSGCGYLAVIMAVFTRGRRGWQLGLTLEPALTVTAWRQALTHRTPAIHHSAQGVQYAAAASINLLEQAHVQIRMAEVGKAWQHGFAERMMRTMKDEEVDLAEYHDDHDAYQQIGPFLEDVYMRKRIHSSLGYLTPGEFESCWMAQPPNREGLH